MALGATARWDCSRLRTRRLLITKCPFMSHPVRTLRPSPAVASRTGSHSWSRGLPVSYGSRRATVAGNAFRPCTVHCIGRVYDSSLKQVRELLLLIIIFISWTLYCRASNRCLMTRGPMTHWNNERSVVYEFNHDPCLTMAAKSAFMFNEWIKQ